MPRLVMLSLLLSACGSHRVERCAGIALGHKAASLELSAFDSPYRCAPLAARSPPPSNDVTYTPSVVSIPEGPLNAFECCCDVAAGATHGCVADCASPDYKDVRPRKVTDPDFTQGSAGDRGSDQRDLGACFVWVRGDVVVGRFFLAH